MYLLMVHKKITLLICLKLVYFHFVFTTMSFVISTIITLFIAFAFFLSVFPIFNFFHIYYLWLSPRNVEYSNTIWLQVLDLSIPIQWHRCFTELLHFLEGQSMLACWEPLQIQLLQMVLEGPVCSLLHLAPAFLTLFLFTYDHNFSLADVKLILNLV